MPLVGVKLGMPTPYLGGGAAGPVPTWAFVQGKIDTSGSGTSKAVALTAPAASGNIIAGSVLLFNTALVTSVTDDKGNIYDLVNSSYDPNNSSGLTITGFKSRGPVTNAPQTLTFNYQSSTLVWIAFGCFSAGITLTGASVDGSQVYLPQTNLFTPNFQSLYANDLQVAGVFGSAAVTPGAGWTAALGSGTQQMLMWRQASAASLTNNAAFNCSGQVWATVFGVAPRARTSWELVQNQIQRSALSTTTGTITFPNTVKAGNLFIGGIAVGTNGNISDITSLTTSFGDTVPIITPNLNGRSVIGGVVANDFNSITCVTSVSETVIFFLGNEFRLPVGKTSVAVAASVMNNGAGPPYTSQSISAQMEDLLYSFLDLGASGDLPSNGFSGLNGQTKTWADAFKIQGAADAAAVAQWFANTSGSNALPLVGLRAS